MTFDRSTVHGQNMLRDNGTRTARDCCRNTSNGQRPNRQQTFRNGTAALMSRSPPKRIADGSDAPMCLVHWLPLADPLACLSLSLTKETAQRPRKGQETRTRPGHPRERPRPLPPIPQTLEPRPHHKGQISAPPHPLTLPKRHHPADRRPVPRHPFRLPPLLSPRTLTLSWTLLIGRRKNHANTRIFMQKEKPVRACGRLPKHTMLKLRKGLLPPERDLRLPCPRRTNHAHRSTLRLKRRRVGRIFPRGTLH